MREADTVARRGASSSSPENLERRPSDGNGAGARDFGDHLWRNRPVLPEGHPDYVCTASIGICLFAGTETIEHLLKNADMAMYRAATVCNTLRFFDPGTQAAPDYAEVICASLRARRLNDGAQPYYQAQIVLRAKRSAPSSSGAEDRSTVAFVPPGDLSARWVDRLILLTGVPAMQSACCQIRRLGWRWRRTAAAVGHCQCPAFRQTTSSTRSAVCSTNGGSMHRVSSLN